MPQDSLASIFAELNHLIARESVLIDWDTHQIPQDSAFEQYHDCERRVQTLLAKLRTIIACNHL